MLVGVGNQYLDAICAWDIACSHGIQIPVNHAFAAVIKAGEVARVLYQRIGQWRRML
ncbi:MAG: hypothetical protein AWT59_3292 [Candidatus Gallionella acididurans]|uniref:Uncharacterized protein n=1 Tax=Candidatus Gallionella acididurans TaxID=1796491 RepID=A0A139BNM2_9PROT|nr:MAG: hypothetical protein AWT59_3292 [Candidatus Gallionella acididurans]